MKVALNLLIPMVVAGLISLEGGVHAERSDAASQQQELQQMMDMLKNSGMDPKQMKQMENMLGGMAQKNAKLKAAKLKKAQQKFEAEDCRSWDG